MSAFGVSSYFLWTQKGQTTLPLVRGSGFLLAFQQLNTFYRYHVLTAAHVSCPVRYKSLYGDTIGFKAIGERHVSTRLLLPGVTTPKVQESFELEFRQHYMPNVDVASLRVKDEKRFREFLSQQQQQQHHEDSAAAKPSVVELIEPDLDPIEEGTELILCGVHTTEERANPNDDGLKMTPMRLKATCKAALLSLEYGTVLLASIDGPADVEQQEMIEHEEVADSAPQGYSSSSLRTGGLPAVPPLPLSMCGGPVLRRSSGKCVGVIAARVLKNAPPRDPQAATVVQDPYLDISEHTALHALWPLDVALVPIGEFYDPLRRCEM